MMMFQRQLRIFVFVGIYVSLAHGSWIKRSDEDYDEVENENEAPRAPSIPEERDNEFTFRNCSEDQFTCRNGKCLQIDAVCDGYDDCDEFDDDDESYESCALNRCNNSTEFHCPWNGRRSTCVPLESVCNGSPDCPHGEDELSCPCLEDQFQCENGRCIPNSYRCDGDDDCRDENPSDESEEYCSVNRCNSTEFFCPWDGRRSRCLPLEEVCDREVNCGNGEDEKSCECVEDEFKCPNGMCVPNWRRCDGSNDCNDEDRSDESEDYCSVNRCNSTEFYCPWDGRRSKCIGLEDVCDRSFDCPNGEDEKSCPCLEDEFKCASGKCIPNSYRCDGDGDCGPGDRSDESEEYCSVNRCNATEFFCPWDGRRAKCIPIEAVCDGENNCQGGEDEKSCPCRDDQFTCDNGKCILSKFRCDQEDDCNDNSDEVGCENAGRSSGNGTADCRRVKFESKNPEIDIVIAVDTDVGDCLEEINVEEGGTSETKTSNSLGSAQIIVYKNKNRQGEKETMNLVKGRCSEVPSGYNDQIESIDNLGNCIIVYEHSDCIGNSAKIRPKSTFVAEDLARIKMSNDISSLEMC